MVDEEKRPCVRLSRSRLTLQSRSRKARHTENLQLKRVENTVGPSQYLMLPGIHLKSEGVFITRNLHIGSVIT